MPDRTLNAAEGSVHRDRTLSAAKGV